MLPRNDMRSGVCEETMKASDSIDDLRLIRKWRREAAENENLLDLSGPGRSRGHAAYWAVMTVMIAGYGAYMSSIFGVDEPVSVEWPAAEAETPVQISAARTPKDDRQKFGARLIHREDAPTSPAAEKRMKAPVMPHRDVEDILPPPASGEDTGKTAFAPAADGMRSEEIVAEETAPMQPATGHEAAERLENENPAGPDIAASAEAETTAPPAKSEASTSFTVYASRQTSSVSPAALAILARINHAAGDWEGELAPASGGQTGERAPTQPASAPLPERKPNAVREIARHEPSSHRAENGPDSRPDPAPVLPSLEIRSYRAGVRAHLAENKPNGGFGAGRVAVSFRLSSDGLVTAANIVTGSNSAQLQQNSIAAVYRAAPFPAAPENSNRQDRSFTVSFEYQ